MTPEGVDPPVDAVERADDGPIDMQCACGERLVFDRSTDRVTCECGATYAVTITRLTAPGDGAER
jgi:hypothetical protein